MGGNHLHGSLWALHGVDNGGRVRGGEAGVEGGQPREERGEVVEALELVLLCLLLLSFCVL